MKPFVKISRQSKSTYFSLCIYDILDKIKDRSNKWFNEVFFEKIVPESIYTGNLLMDLDYMFSEGIWLAELAAKEKFDVRDAKNFL